MKDILRSSRNRSSGKLLVSLILACILSFILGVANARAQCLQFPNCGNAPQIVGAYGTCQPLGNYTCGTYCFSTCDNYVCWCLTTSNNGTQCDTFGCTQTFNPCAGAEYCCD
jgi:hypothetical protein